VADKDTENAEVEPLAEARAVLDEDENISDEDIVEDDEEHADEHINLSSRILRVLAILVIGAVGALWAGPKLAPMLPAGLKPVADFLSPQADISAQLTALQSDFETRIAKIESGNNAQDPMAQISPALDQLKSSDTELAASIDTLTQSGKTLEETVASLQAEVAKMIARQALSAQNGHISDEALQQLETRLTAITAAQQELNQSQTKAVDAQQDAEGKLRLAEATNALTQISDALETGKPFQEPLVQFSSVMGITAPTALLDIAKNGTPHLFALKQQLPPLARLALRNDAAESADDTALGKFSAFLKSQVGTRSLQPQTGDGMDAVLSRIEAALETGDLGNALTQTDALSDPALQIMGDWVASLTQLNNAKNAVQALQKQLITNRAGQ